MEAAEGGGEEGVGEARPVARNGGHPEGGGTVRPWGGAYGDAEGWGGGDGEPTAKINIKYRGNKHLSIQAWGK